MAKCDLEVKLDKIIHIPIDKETFNQIRMVAVEDNRTIANTARTFLWDALEHYLKDGGNTK